jgi:acid phosphatase
LAHLLVGFAEAAAEKYNPSLSELDEKLSKFINGNPVRVDGKPRASGILDTVSE